MSVDHQNRADAPDPIKAGSLQGYWQAARSSSPSLRRFLLASALSITVFFGLTAVLQNIFLLRLGFDARFIGLLLAVGQIVWASAALPAGLVSNRIGLRNGILLGYGAGGLGLALLLLVESQPEARWQPWLLGSQALVMVGVAFITVNIPSYLMAVTGERERRYAFAVFQAIGPAMAFVGSLLGGLLPGLFAGWFNLSLQQPAPYRLALWAGPILLSLAILPLLGADPARMAVRGEQQSDSGALPIKWLLFFGLFAFLQVIGEGAVRAFFNIYLDTGLAVPTAQIGTVMALAQLLPIVVVLSAPLLIARVGAGYTLAAAAVGSGLCLLPLATAPQLPVAALAFMGVNAMAAVTGMTRDLFGQEMALPRWRTTSQGVAIIGLALGWATAGIVGGALISRVGFGAVFLVGAMTALTAAALLVGFLRRRSAQAGAGGAMTRDS